MDTSASRPEGAFTITGGMSEAEACEIRDDKLLKMLKYSKELGDALPPASSQVDTMKVAS